MKEYRQGDYIVRKFEEDEWQQLKAIRLEALKEYPDRLNQPYAEALEYTDSDWQNILKNQNEITYAICYRDEVIGYHFVRKYQDKQDIAASNGSYIRRQHNWRGIDQLLFASAVDWAKENKCHQFVAFCKETNLASLRLFKKYGGVFASKCKEEIYPDGSVASAVQYILKL